MSHHPLIDDPAMAMDSQGAPAYPTVVPTNTAAQTGPVPVVPATLINVAQPMQPQYPPQQSQYPPQHSLPHFSQAPPPMQPQVPVYNTPPRPEGVIGDRVLIDVFQRRRVNFSFTKYLAEGWNFFKHNWKTLVPMTIVWSLFAIIVYVILVKAIFGAAYGDDEHTEEERELPAGFMILLSLFLLSFECLVVAPYYASMFMGIFKAIRQNSKLEWKDYYSGYACNVWPSLVPVACVTYIIRRLARIFWPIVIYFAIVSIFTFPFFVEHKGLGVRSILWSFKVVHRYICDFIGCILCLFVMNFVGMLMLGVGLFVTIPLTLVVLAFCYHHTVGILGVPHEDELVVQQPPSMQQIPVGIPVNANAPNTFGMSPTELR